MQPDYSKLDPELQDKIKKWQDNAPANKQIQALNDLGDMVQEIVSLFDEQKESSKKSVDQLGATLLDIREKLTSLDNKEDPEEVDYSKPIVEAVKKMQKSLEDSIKGIEVKPEVKVNVPDVVVPDAPEVDLSALEKLVKTELPKAFEKAIKLIPTTPAVELTPLEQAIRETHDNMMEMLQSIDTASRMKPQFPVTQLNQMKTSLDTIATNTASSGAVSYATKIDTSTTSGVTYIGKAAIGSSGASAVWQLKKLDSNTLALDKTWADGDALFDNVWDNRATTVVYS